MQPFDPTGVVFEGVPVKQVASVKVVGYTFDTKLCFAEMVQASAQKARSRVGMLRRLSGFLDSDNLQLMYTAFIRPVMGMVLCFTSLLLNLTYLSLTGCKLLLWSWASFRWIV